MTAALPMGNQKITGMADPTVATDAATKNYVDTATAAFFSTGDVKLTIKTVADTGWVMVASITGNAFIGNAGSGAPTRASADCQALFNLVFNNLSDANAPLLTSGGGATTRAAQTNAATAWAANCRIQVGFYAARAVGFAGNPAELPTNRNLGDHIGVETVALVAGNIPTITAVNASQAISVAGPNGHTMPYDQIMSSMSNVGGAQQVPVGGAVGTNNFIGSNSISTTYTNASPTAISLYQPIAFLNCMIKL